MIVDDFAEPGEIDGVRYSDPVTLAWDQGPPGSGATHDIARGAFEFPVGSGASEICFGSEPGDSIQVSELPAAGTGHWYLVRGRNDCGTGTWGEQTDTMERTPAVCP